MLSWKILQLLVLMFSAYKITNGLEFEPCFPAIKNEACNMTCRVKDLKEIVDVYCNGTSRGSCSDLFCPSNMIREGNDTVLLTLSSLSYASDNCEWSCTYGPNSSLSSNVTVYSGIPSPLNLTGQMNEDGVKLTAIADCLYPYNPVVMVEYSIQRDGEYVSLVQRVDRQSSSTPGGCSDAIEKRVTAISDVSAKHKDLAGKSIFFRMKFSQYTPGPENYTNVEGPFYFEGCNYLDTELFLGGFSCFLIVLITTIIMLIILACKMLPEKFGDLSTNKKTIKIIIIAVFILVALIIGLALGFGLKECNQRDLGLGLGLGLGFLLAIALVVTLYIYHRQCDSKKGNEDENRFSLDSCFRKCQVKPEKEMESPTEINSKKPEDNPKRVRSTASASHVKMESKVHSEN